MSRLRLQRLFRGLSIALVISAVGCSRGSSRSHSSLPPLEVLLADPILWKSPALDPSSAGEEALLDSFDAGLDGLLFSTGRNNVYHGWLDELGAWAGIDPYYEIAVAEDFRYHRELEGLGGGVAGHELVLLDGKLLDILLEYSTFLALWQRGDEVRDPVDALDEIVFLHNEILGATTAGFDYRYQEVDDDAAWAADQYFLSFLSGLLYHEFGRLYLGHALQTLRRVGGLEVLLPADRLDEGDADLVGGMLLAKAGFGLADTREMLDILTYSLEQRFDRELRYWDVLSVEFQEAFLSERHAPLVVRKSRFAEGFHRYRAAHGY